MNIYYCRVRLNTHVEQKEAAVHLYLTSKKIVVTKNIDFLIRFLYESNLLDNLGP